MTTQTQNGTSGALLSGHVSIVPVAKQPCPCELLKVGQSTKEKGFAQIKQGEETVKHGEEIIQRALAELRKFTEVNHTHSTPEVVPPKSVSIPVFETKQKVSRRGKKIPTKDCTALIYAFIAHSKEIKDDWVSFKKIEAGTGLSERPVRRGIEALLKSKKIKKVEKVGNPEYTGKWQHANKKHLYYELR